MVPKSTARRPPNPRVENPSAVHHNVATMSRTMPQTKQHPPADRDADPAAIIAKGKAVLDKESAAIRAAAERMGESFVRAVRLLLACRGRVAVTGMGKPV